MKKLSIAEISMLAFIFFAVIMGIILSYINLDFFLNHYVIEDGIIEWLTVIGLVAGTVITFRRAAKLFSSRGLLFTAFTIGLGLLMILAAGEEISWGQRIFGIESSEFFIKNNAQAETNLHNLVSNGVKINRILSTSITISLIIYMILLPLVYDRNKKLQGFIDHHGVILPRTCQTFSLAMIAGLTYLVPHGKRSELLEFAMVFIFLLIVFYPKNDHIYRKELINGR